MSQNVGVAMTVLGLAVALAAERFDAPRVLRPAKATASVGFLVVALGVGALGSRYGVTVFVGLVLCLIGDVFLTWRDKARFRAGIAAFLLGHVAYTVAFAARGADAAWIGFGLVGTALAAAAVLRWLMPSVTADMRVPVVAYVVAISAMVAAALGTHGFGPRPAIVAGALGFYLSDLAVARDRFVTQGFVNRALGLPLYYASQLLLASSTASG